MRTVWNPAGVTWSSPVPDELAPGTPTGLKATPWDWQRIDLTWEPSADDVMVDHYEIHRSTSAGFSPDASTLVARAGEEHAKDPGLLAGTAYHYRVVAVDTAGRRGTASPEITARTPVGIGKRRLRIASIAVEPAAGGARGTMTLTDEEGRPVEGATVSGSFDGAAGRTFTGVTDASGAFSASSEDLAAPWTVLFVPERISVQGFYWASSLDVAHLAESSHTIATTDDAE
jgi:chitodextrinase